MIAPSSRLLLWFALVVLPAAALASVSGTAALFSTALVMTLVLVVVLDALFSQKSLDALAVELPDVVRLSKDNEASFYLAFINNSEKATSLRVGIPFPPQIHSPAYERAILLPADTPKSQLEWKCTGLQRGQYHLQQCCLERGSALGLWRIRRSKQVKCEMRVYPNLLAERNNLAALFLNKGNLGIHAQRQVGKGRDFEKLREYIPGDSYEDIHWKATAKRGYPVTKVFQIERTQEVYVIIDASRLSARLADTGSPTVSVSEKTSNGFSMPLESSHVTILERFLTSSLVMALAAQRQGDLFGVLSFSDRVHEFVRAKNGMAHYGLCRDALYRLEPQIVTPDYKELFAFIRLKLNRRALLIILTNLDDPNLAESFARHLDVISRCHLVLVNMLKPSFAEPIFSNPEVRNTDDLYRSLAGHYYWQELSELGKVLQKKGVRFGQLTNEKLCLQLVSQYINIKQRQLI